MIFLKLLSTETLSSTLRYLLHPSYTAHVHSQKRNILHTQTHKHHCANHIFSLINFSSFYYFTFRLCLTFNRMFLRKLFKIFFILGTDHDLSLVLTNVSEQVQRVDCVPVREKHFQAAKRVLRSTCLQACLLPTTPTTPTTPTSSVSILGVRLSVLLFRPHGRHFSNLRNISDWDCSVLAQLEHASNRQGDEQTNKQTKFARETKKQ